MMLAPLREAGFGMGFASVEGTAEFTESQPAAFPPHAAIRRPQKFIKIVERPDD